MEAQSKRENPVSHKFGYHGSGPNEWVYVNFSEGGGVFTTGFDEFECSYADFLEIGRRIRHFANIEAENPGLVAPSADQFLLMHLLQAGGDATNLLLAPTKKVLQFYIWENGCGGKLMLSFDRKTAIEFAEKFDLS